MPRYRDQWLTDRVLFDYLSGGQCACCGLSHMFLPNGTADLITAVSDLETDQAKKEIENLNNAESPWPAELRDQIWADRVRLRQKLKPGMKVHAAFWKEHGSGFEEWCHRRPVSFWRRVFQLPRSEIMEWARMTYNIHSAFGVVICAIVEQVAFFELTAYPLDGRGSDELDFEKALVFKKQAGFTLNNVEAVDENNDTLRSDILETWMNRMKSLCGPKLLQKGKTVTNSGGVAANESDEEGEEEAGGTDDPSPTSEAGSAGFASDRRVVRLLIARYWAEEIQKKYLKEVGT